MRSSVQAFIQQSKAELLANAKKLVKEPVFDSILTFDSKTKKKIGIMDAQKPIELSGYDIDRARHALAKLLITKENVGHTLDALNGFDALDKSQLLLAGDFISSYIYLLGNILDNQHNGLEKHSKINRGIASLRVFS